MIIMVLLITKVNKKIGKRKSVSVKNKNHTHTNTNSFSYCFQHVYRFNSCYIIHQAQKIQCFKVIYKYKVKVRLLVAWLKYRDFTTFEVAVCVSLIPHYRF